MQEELTEGRIQQDCFTWFNNTYPTLRGTMWMVYNNPKNKIQGAILKSKGMISGVSDLQWFYHGILYCLELKTQIGKLSPAQQKWSGTMTYHGAEYVVIRSLSQFQDLVKTVIADAGHEL
jgi:hypothetical protein